MSYCAAFSKPYIIALICLWLIISISNPDYWTIALAGLREIRLSNTSYWSQGTASRGTASHVLGLFFPSSHLAAAILTVLLGDYCCARHNHFLDATTYSPNSDLRKDIASCNSLQFNCDHPVTSKVLLTCPVYNANISIWSFYSLGCFALFRTSPRTKQRFLPLAR